MSARKSFAGAIVGICACLISGMVPFAVAQIQHRTTLSLDGQWDVEDNMGADAMPKEYTHTVSVPGLAHSAIPAFPNVDQYQSREPLSNLARQGRIPKAEFEKLRDARGISLQKRSYFWYRKISDAPANAAVAILNAYRRRRK